MKMKRSVLLLTVCLLAFWAAAPAMAAGSTAEDPVYIGFLDAGYRIYYGQAVQPYLNKDYETAFPYALQAADMGVPEAENMMGTMYQNGLGTEKDLEWAFYYYLCASLDGAFSSPLSLSQFYANGIGTEKDQEKADYWLNVYNEIQADPPPRNQIVSQDETAVVYGSRKVVIVDTAEMYISSWSFLRDYTYLDTENDDDVYYAYDSGEDQRFFVVHLSYANISAESQLYDDYITHVSLEYGSGTTVDRHINIMQYIPSSGVYTSPEIILEPGDEMIFVFRFTLPKEVATSDQPIIFSLRYNGNPISFVLR